MIKINQNNALRLVSFATSFRDHVSPIYYRYELLKLRDHVTLQNLLIHDFFNGKLPNSFKNYFTLSSDLHNHGTRGALRGLMWAPNIHSVHYGRNSRRNQAILSWNNFIKEFPAETDFLKFSRAQFKKCVSNHFIESYNS